MDVEMCIKEERSGRKGGEADLSGPPCFSLATPGPGPARLDDPLTRSLDQLWNRFTVYPGDLKISQQLLDDCDETFTFLQEEYY